MQVLVGATRRINEIRNKTKSMEDIIDEEVTKVLKNS
jgi:hypothetical protein